jgi:hypothetical protein
MAILGENTINALQRRCAENIPYIKNVRYLWWNFIQSNEEDDTRARFKKNLITQAQDWKYRAQPVFYELNRYWFRCRDFASYDWSNSIVIVGETNLFGVGLDESETFSTQLEQKVGVPCINLSGVGYSNAMIANNIKAILNEVKPKALIVGWSPFDRWAYPHHLSNAWVVQYRDQLPSNYAPLYDNTFKNDLFSLTIQNKSLEAISEIKKFTADSSISTCHLCFFDIASTAGIEPSSITDIYYTSPIDRSRNLITAGSLTIAQYVNYASEQLASAIL